MATDLKDRAANEGSRLSRAARWTGRRLVAPARRRFWKRITLQLKAVRLFATELVLFVVVVGGSILIIHEINTPSVRISVSTVPEDLRASGLTEAVATELMRAELEQIQIQAQTSMEYARTWREDQTIQFSIPGTGLGLGDVIQHIKRFVNKSDTAITVYMARINGQLGVTFRSSRQELPLTQGWLTGATEAEVIHIAAEQIARSTQPYILASYYYSIHELEKCRKLVDDIHRAFPRNTAIRARAYNLSGILLSDAGDVAGALREYEQALVHDPLADYAYLNIGNAYANQSKFADAEAAYRKSIRINPSYVFAHNALGNSLVDQGKHVEAESAYRTAIGLDGKFSGAFNGLGNALTNQGKFQEAVTAYQQAVELDRESFMAWTNLCIAQFEHDLVTDAKVSCDTAIALAPKDPWVNTVFEAYFKQKTDLDMPTAASSQNVAPGGQTP